MAIPKLSNVQMKSILMRIPAVKAATQAVPNALLALCNMMLPMAVIENCSPMGIPMYNSVRAKAPLNFRSEGVARRMSK